MVVYYRGPCSRITHELFETWCPTYRHYLLRDLRGVRVVEQATATPAAVRSIRDLSTGVAGATAVAGALGWVEGWQAYESPAVGLALLALLAASGTVSGACWRVHRLQLELSAVYLGEQVTLYRSTDRCEFHQVRRGLLRALDQLDETR